MSVDLLQIFQLLVQNRKGVTKRKIAETLEKSVRQIERDLNKIRSAGFPLVTDGDPNAGVALRYRIDREDFTGLPDEMPPLHLTQSEVWLLLAAVEAVDLPRGKWLEELQRGLLEKIDISEKHRTAPIRASLAVPRPHVGPREIIHRAAFDNMLDAITRQRRVKVTYPWKRGPKTARKFSPLGFVLAHGSIYVLGHVANYKDARYIKMSKVERVQVLDEEAPVEDADALRSFLKDHFGFWDEKPQKVRIRFATEVAHAITEGEIHPSQEIEHCDNGDVILTMRVGGQYEVIRWVLEWGEDAELLAPAAWRRAMAGIVKNMAARYD